MKIGFDHDQYTRMQSEHIRERISQFGGKLYLELGGKLFDDNHASRVLPGFRPDSKISMLLTMRDQAELVIVINADDIEKNKVRGDRASTASRRPSPSRSAWKPWACAYIAIIPFRAIPIMSI